MNLGQVDILDIVGIVRVYDLTASPIDALDLHDFAIFDRRDGGDYYGKQPLR